MQRTFAQYLRQFALSVDIVNEDTFKEIKALIERYVREMLNITYFEFMREHIVSGSPGLETTWATTADSFSEKIKSDDGQYTNQMAYVFDQDTPLWVVNNDKSPLANAESYIDLWSGREQLPKYMRPNIEEEIRTAIILPLRKKNGVGLLGVLDFESSTYLEATEVAKRELRLISESLSILSELQVTSLNQRESTKKALSELGDTLASRYLPKLTKPKLFFAAPFKSDQTVVRLIRNVLNAYTDKLNIVAWNEISESGNINEQIISEVLSSRYGVCYFSEIPGNSSDVKFCDNANVLFEAGMLHVLSHADNSLSEGWIPIREQESPSVPFDFASERILIVKRSTEGGVNEEEFQTELRERVDKLIDTRWD